MDILIHILVYVFFTMLILAGLGFIVLKFKYFYYHEYSSDSVKVYYDDNDHQKGYYIVKRPQGPYPVGYPKDRIIADMEDFERLKREEKAKRKRQLNMSQIPNNSKETTNTTINISSKPRKQRPKWLQILLMTPAEYNAYKKQNKS